MSLKNFGIITEKDYVGKTLEDAEKKAKNDGFTTRVVEKDGQQYMVTMEYRTDRINFRVRNNIVTSIYGG